MKNVFSVLLISVLLFSQLHAEKKTSNIQTVSKVNEISDDKLNQSTNITSDTNVTNSNVEVVQNDGFTAKKALVYAAMPVYIAGAIVYYAVLTVVVTPIWLVQKAFGVDQNKK